MTQPGISKAVSSLESTLQLPLFERSGKTVSLTKEGSFLHKKWSAVLSDLQNSCREARSLNEKIGMTLKIGITNTNDANLYFWDLLQNFKKKYPEISVITESEDMKSLEYNL